MKKLFTNFGIWRKFPYTKCKETLDLQLEPISRVLYRYLELMNQGVQVKPVSNRVSERTYIPIVPMGKVVRDSPYKTFKVTSGWEY